MDRRKFLKFLGIGLGAATAVAVAPELLAVASKPAGYATYICGRDAILTPQVWIGSYNNYANFSSFALSESMDEAVAKAADELGVRAGQSFTYNFKAGRERADGQLQG